MPTHATFILLAAKEVRVDSNRLHNNMIFLVINIKDEFRCIKRRPLSILLPRAAAIFGKFPEISKQFSTYMNNNRLKADSDGGNYRRKNKYAIKHIFNIVTHGNYKSF